MIIVRIRFFITLSWRIQVDSVFGVGFYFKKCFWGKLLLRQDLQISECRQNLNNIELFFNPFGSLLVKAPELVSFETTDSGKAAENIQYINIELLHTSELNDSIPLKLPCMLFVDSL